MNDAASDALPLPVELSQPVEARPPQPAPRWQLRLPAVPLAVAALLLVFLAFRPVRDNPRLIATFLGVAGVLASWSVVLWVGAARSGRNFGIQPVILRSHYLQGMVQFSVYLYWGWYSPGIYAEMPLILAQLLYLYALDALLSWSRGKPWQTGFGPFPVVLSTNLLLWFRPDWYFLQFAMITTGALGKAFIRWKRDGRVTHIFNPSVFGQSLFGIVLIATGTTTFFTMGEELSVAFETMAFRHMHVFLFLLGITVQLFFPVTLMTLAGTAAICLLNLAYTHFTGTYFFVTLNIGATVFLGLHLLMTDPSTSPSTNAGKVIFGVMYGVGYFALSGVLDLIGAPLFWDKLLPVPIMNLCVPWIDRMARSGALGRLNRKWEGALRPRTMQFVHMGAWTALFLALLLSGFLGSERGPHEGRSLAFWKQAYDEGRFRAGERLMDLVKRGVAAKSGEAYNMLGLLSVEGKLVAKDDHEAARDFAMACELGYAMGCQNMVGQYVSQGLAYARGNLAHGFDALEAACAGKTASADGSTHLLLAIAYELGRGRPVDKARALQLYDDGCALGNQEACASAQRLRGGAPAESH